MAPPTNVMAILSVVFIFVLAPVGLAFGLIARRQIAQSGESGDGLALAGVIVNGILTGLFVLLVVFLIVAFTVLGLSLR